MKCKPEVAPGAGEPFRIGGRYNWKHQPERLIYMGLCEPRNGRWHQFAKVDAPGVVWCEVTDADLSSFEATPEPAAAPSGASDVQAIMVMVYDYASISDGIDAAEGAARTAQLREMKAKADEIRAALAHPSEAQTQTKVEARAGLTDAKDAARYRYLVAECNIDFDPSEQWQLVISEPGTGEDWKAKLDAVIDAAIVAGTTKEKP